MSNIKNLKTNKLLVSIIGVIVLAGVTLTILQLTHTTHFFQSANQKQKKQEQRFNSSNKEAVVDGSGNPAKSDSSGVPVTSTGTYTPPANANGITLSANQEDANVTITTKLDGYSDGTCALTLNNPATGKSAARNAKVIYASEFSTCAGFSIPVSELGAGNWSLSLAVTAGGVTNNKTASVSVR